MRFGMIIGGLEALAGIVTLNPALIADGARRTVTSYVIGEALEPAKDLVGDGMSDVIDAVIQ